MNGTSPDSSFLPPLDRPCEVCGGLGYVRYPGGKFGGVDCETCSGRGHVPTPAGEQVLSFLFRHYSSLAASAGGVG